MFVWRIVRRIRDIVLLKRFAVLQVMKYKANEEYADIAAKMTTRLTTEEFERNMAVKYSALLESNKEEAEKQIAKDREMYNDAMQKNAEYEIALKESAAAISKSKKEMAELQAKCDESDRRAARSERKSKKESRSVDDIDDAA